MCLDTLCLYLSVAGAVVAVLIQHKVMFRNCLIFAMKFYPSSCIYSLYKKIGGHPITFSNYTALGHHTPLANPAIRLARSDNEFIKPRVSFQNVAEDGHSMSEPNLSPQNVKHHEASILKPCFRKNLQLPINNSYP